jgi:hypothetical protein
VTSNSDLRLIKTAFEKGNSLLDCVEAVKNSNHVLNTLVHEELSDTLRVKLKSKLSRAQVCRLNDDKTMACPPVDEWSVTLEGGKVIAGAMAVGEKNDRKLFSGGGSCDFDIEIDSTVFGGESDRSKGEDGRGRVDRDVGCTTNEGGVGELHC